MMRNKYSDDDFITAVKTSVSIAEVLRKLGQSPSGGSYATFNLRVKRLDIDTAHFLGEGHLKGKTHNWSPKISLTDLLVANSDKVFGTRFKRRLIDEGLLKNECYECGLKDNWNNKPIVLHLDHINGDHFDHRIENLRLLCPNCHSQTPTYCSKNFKLNEPEVRVSEFVPQEKHKCETCGDILKDGRYRNCRDCYNKNRKLLQTPYDRTTKIVWPSIEELETKLQTMSYVSLAKELGVSDNAIRKHIKNNQ